MKMAIKDGNVILKGWDDTQYNVIASWGKTVYLKKTKDRDAMLVGPCEAEFLNRLAQLIKLPAPAEAIRDRLNRTQAAVDRMRATEHVEPLIKPPVKVNLFQHQIRGYNMALITFGLVEVT